MNCVKASMQGVENYIKKSKERLITAACNSSISSNGKTTKSRKQKWEEKQLNEYIKRQTAKTANEKTWI